MKEHFVIDPLISKRQQLLLATQLCRMVLKVRIVTFPPLFRNELSFVAPHTPWCDSPFPLSLPLPSRLCNLALLTFPPLRPSSGSIARPGKRGSRDKGVARGVRFMQAALFSLHANKHHPPFFSLCVTVYPHRWITALLQTITDTNAQVNNVIIAGNDDQDF